MRLLLATALWVGTSAQVFFETEVRQPTESCLELVFKFAGAPAPTRVGCQLAHDEQPRDLRSEHRIDGSSRWELRICAPVTRPVLVLGPTSNHFSCAFEGTGVNVSVRTVSSPIHILPKGQTGTIAVWSVSTRRRMRQPMPRILDIAAVASQPGAHCLQVAWDPGWDTENPVALIDRLCRSKLDNTLPQGPMLQPGNTGGLRAAVFGKAIPERRARAPEPQLAIGQPRTWGDRLDRLGRMARRVLSSTEAAHDGL